MTRLRLLAGPLATVAATGAVLYWLWPMSPVLCLLAIAVVLVFGMVFAPSFFGAIRKVVAWTAGTIAAHAITARDRLAAIRECRRYHLTRAEHDSRKRIGMPLGHLERLVYDSPLAGWQVLEDELWPDGWTRIIEEHWRDQERGRQQ